jgi:multidrug efflux pump subunit AcrA (membrane-fusion protein)
MVFFTSFIFLSLAFAKASNLPVVITQSAQPTDLYDSMTYPTRILAKVNASVLSEVEGVVTKLVAPLGARVKPGNVLMILKSTDPVFDYALMRVRAPVAGVVGSPEVTEGSRVNKGHRLVTVTDPSQLRLLIELPAVDLPFLEMGLKGTVTFPGEEKIFNTVVSGVSGSVDPATGTATAELKLKDKLKDKLKEFQNLRPGLIGKASFKIREHQGFEMPETALVYRGNGIFLRLVRNGRIKLSPISAGPTRRGQIEVKKGLSAGDIVVMRSSIYVAEGEAVEIEKGEE